MEVLTGRRQVWAGGARTPTPREALRSFVNRLLRLTSLAPDIPKPFLNGREPKGMQLEVLAKVIPSGWDEQRKAIYPLSVWKNSRKYSAYISGRSMSIE